MHFCGRKRDLSWQPERYQTSKEMLSSIETGINMEMVTLNTSAVVGCCYWFVIRQSFANLVLAVYQWRAVTPYLSKHLPTS